MSNFYCILNILSIIQKTLHSTYSSYFIRHLLCLSLAHRSSSSFVGFDSKHSLIFKELTGLFWSTWFIQYCCGCPVLVTKCPSMEQSGVSFRSTGIKKFLYLVSSCDEFPCLQGGKMLLFQKLTVTECPSLVSQPPSLLGGQNRLKTTGTKRILGSASYLGCVSFVETDWIL